MLIQDELLKIDAYASAQHAEGVMRKYLAAASMIALTMTLSPQSRTAEGSEALRAGPGCLNSFPRKISAFLPGS
jgi:hypothetical protein